MEPEFVQLKYGNWGRCNVTEHFYSTFKKYTLRGANYECDPITKSEEQIASDSSIDMAMSKTHMWPIC